jgi:hypothetical protein
LSWRIWPLARSRSVQLSFVVGKETIVCGFVAFLFYSYPVLSQALLIGILGLLWLSYACKMIRTIRRKNARKGEDQVGGCFDVALGLSDFAGGVVGFGFNSKNFCA